MLDVEFLDITLSFLIDLIALLTHLKRKIHVSVIVLKNVQNYFKLI